MIFVFVPESFFELYLIIPKKIFTIYGFEEKSSLTISVIVNKLMCYLIIFIIVMISYKIYLTFRKKITIVGNNYRISIEYGDLLEINDCKRVISFDECFTSQVGKKPADINSLSLCGQYLNKHPEINITSLLSASGLKPIGKSKYKNKDSYEPGRVIPNDNDLLLAFTKLDKNGVGKMSRSDYIKCLFVLWEEINNNYGQSDVCLPILGSGITRIEGGSGASISQQELLDMMIWSYRLCSNKLKLPSKLRIICKKNEGFSLDKIDNSII